MCAEDTFRLNTGMFVITGDSLLGCVSSVGQSDSSGDYSDCRMATLRVNSIPLSVCFTPNPNT